MEMEDGSLKVYGCPLHGTETEFNWYMLMVSQHEHPPGLYSHIIPGHQKVPIPLPQLPWVISLQKRPPDSLQYYALKGYYPDNRG